MLTCVVRKLFLTCLPVVLCPLIAQAQSDAEAGAELSPPAGTEAPLERVFRSMEQLDELISLGLPGLAMRLIEQQQNLYPAWTHDWYAFEFKRINTLISTEAWQAVIERTGFVLDNASHEKGEINTDVANWFRTQRAIALLKAARPEAALSLSRHMLWNTPGANTRLVRLWRRLVIRAYLQMDLADDARRSLVRYRQDYGSLSSEFRLLQARALLKDRRPQEAALLLADESSHTARALRLIALVRARPLQASKTVEEVRALLDNENLGEAQRRAYRFVLYEAARLQDDTVAAARALELMLSLSRKDMLLGDEFDPDGDDLWQLYERVGKEAGNRYGLLLGEDLAWYEQAGKIEAESPVVACGMYTVLALSTVDDSHRRAAHDRITRILAGKENGLEIVNQLYLHSAIVEEKRNIPEAVRYRLVDYALSVGDIALAAEMMSTLPRPPEQEDAFNWQMRKARVLILEGRYEEGEHELQSSLQGRQMFDAEMIDRFLQVVFDLQTIDRHEQALAMFDLLPEGQLDDKTRRELFYWKAESNAAIDRFDLAAWLYLKSAVTGDPQMTDLWAQSARFKAADALLSAGLYEDARHAYTELLEITASESRRRLIRQKLQHVRLLENAGGAEADEPAAGEERDARL